jgi:hypothetical protein
MTSLNSGSPLPILRNRHALLSGNAAVIDQEYARGAERANHQKNPKDYT